VKPEIHILGLSIKTFGVAFACGFLAAGAIVARRFRELGKPVDWAYELTGAALVGGLIGSRGYYLIQHWGSVKHDVIGSIFSGSGLVWYGGAIGGAICVLAWAWWRGMLNAQLLDLAAIPLALGYAIGRIGCQVSGDGDYGKPFHGLTAMGYPHGTVPTPPGVTVYPTPIYETVAMGLGAWVLWRLRDRVRPGLVFAGYLVLAGSERFLIEFLRRNHRVAAGLTAPQFESLALLAAGLIWLAVALRRSGGAWAPSTA
jgi:phosphatidylglycerol---prolipoprotein diacylglyceryl transferase